MPHGRSSEIEYGFEILNTDSLDQVTTLAAETLQSVSDPALYLLPDRHLITRCLGNERLSVGAFRHNRLIAYRLVYVPGPDDHDFAGVCGLNVEQRLQLAHSQSTAVSKEARDKGIGKKLVQYSFEVMRKKGFIFNTATCHPSNTRSLKSLTQLGFTTDHVVHQIEEQPRYILMKVLENLTQ